MRLYLDDKRDAPEGWHLIRNPYGILSILSDSFPGEIEALSFDHDLGYFLENGEERTGYWLLAKIEELAFQSKEFRAKVPNDLRIHSANSAVYKKMEQAIESIRRMKNVEAKT
jgi:hypothetical protein